MSHLKLKVIAAVAALAMGGNAMANTNLNGDTTGDLFLNVVDTVSGTSFLFDTGVAQSAFNGNGTYSFDLSSLASADWSSFLTGSTGHALEYSVLSAATPTASSATIFFTGNQAPTATVGANISQAQGGVSGFAQGANSISGTSTNSVVLNGSYSWSDGLNGGLVSTNLFSVANGLGAAPGTALAFYSETSSNLRSVSIAATLATFAGSWSLNGNLLSYTPVPLPTPIVLLLSGLCLMALVSRRRKTESMGFAAAAV